MAHDASPGPRVEGHASTAGTLAGALVGGVFLAWIAGTGPLDPTNLDWAMKLDWAEHVFGWHFFRTEPWQWPPGAIHGYFAPLGTSVGLTDSIPFAAYLLKPFDRWLPPLVQYLGLWWLLCFVLQGALGARLTSRATSSPVAQALGGTLFVLLPTLLARVGHAALCSHWLLLWALLIATRPESTRHRPWEWAVLGLVAGMVMPYLAVMVLALLLGPALRGTERVGAAPRLMALGAALAATIAGWWLSGMFVLSGAGALAEGGLGYFSMNLLAPVSPHGWSRFLPELPVASEGQSYEGFQYLGLGVLTLAAVAIGLAMRGAPGAVRAPSVRYGRGLVVTAMLMAAFALSPRVTLGAWTLVDLNGPWVGPLAAFRSSGRFGWPLTYVTLTWIVTTVARRLPPAGASGVLAGAVLLQLLDLHGAHRARYETTRSAAFYAWEQPFVSERWPEVLAGRSHLVVAPPPQCGRAPVAYEPVLRLAATHGLTANVGVVSRVDAEARARYCTELASQLDRAALEADSVYLVDAATADDLNARAGSPAPCAQLDRLWVCGTARALPPP